MSNENQFWTEQDIELVKELYEAGISVATIANTVKRSEKAVYALASSRKIPRGKHKKSPEAPNKKSPEASNKKSPKAPNKRKVIDDADAIQVHRDIPETLYNTSWAAERQGVTFGFVLGAITVALVFFGVGLV